MNQHQRTLTPRTPQTHETALDQIGEALRELRFGAITIAIHEGRVTQIDVTEKRRLTL